MNAEMGRTLAAGTNRVQQLQLPIDRINGKRTDRTRFLLADPLCLVRRIQMRPRAVESQCARAGSHLDQSAWRHGPRGAIYLK